MADQVNIYVEDTLNNKVTGTAVSTKFGLDVNVVNSGVATSSAQLPVALGQGTMAQSLKVVVASDQSQVPVNLSAGSFSVSQVDITTAATQILASPLSNRRSIVIHNLDDENRVFIGTSNAVTTSNGFCIEPETSQGYPLNASVTSIYLIADTATCRVSIMELT